MLNSRRDLKIILVIIFTLSILVLWMLDHFIIINSNEWMILQILGGWLIIFNIEVQSRNCEYIVDANFILITYN